MGLSLNTTLGVNLHLPRAKLHHHLHLQIKEASNLSTNSEKEFGNILKNDQEFIDFRGTSASDSSASISSSTDEGESKVGAIRISVNGTDRFIRIYDTAI